MKKAIVFIGLLLMLCVSCATSTSSKKYSYVYDIGVFKKKYNSALEFEKQQMYKNVYSILTDDLYRFLDTAEGKDAYDRLTSFLFGFDYDIKYLYGEKEISKENARKIIVDLREKVPELHARVQAKFEEESARKNHEAITKFEPAYNEVLKLENEGKIEEAYKLMQPFYEFKLNDELKAKFNECYSRLEQKIKENQVKQMLNEKKSLYQILFPRFLSFIESEDINLFESKSYLELKNKYPSFDLDRISSFENTIFSEYDEFELYDICIILDNDLRSSLFNCKLTDIFKNVWDNVKWSIKSIEPNFKNKTYTYNLDLSIEFLFNGIFASVIDLFESCHYKDFDKYLYGLKEKVRNGEIDIYYNMGINLISDEGEEYHSIGKNPIRVELDIPVYIYDSVDPKYAVFKLSRWYSEKFSTFTVLNVPYKTYKSINLSFSNLKMEEKNRTNNTSAYNNKTSQSNSFNSSSNSSLKDLFGTIICEECGKHLALYDCFDPVKNVKVSLCRPCLQKKEQEYNAKYQKAINDIYNL